MRLSGYWGQPDETTQALLPGGWFRSGDVAMILKRPLPDRYGAP